MSIYYLWARRTSHLALCHQIMIQTAIEDSCKCPQLQKLNYTSKVTLRRCNPMLILDMYFFFQVHHKGNETKNFLSNHIVSYLGGEAYATLGAECAPLAVITCQLPISFFIINFMLIHVSPL
ncbi:unnamed protein product, partial [Vitis vinifera]